MRSLLAYLHEQSGPRYCGSNLGRAEWSMCLWWYGSTVFHLWWLHGCMLTLWQLYWKVPLFPPPQNHQGSFKNSVDSIGICIELRIPVVKLPYLPFNRKTPVDSNRDGDVMPFPNCRGRRCHTTQFSHFQWKLGSLNSLSFLVLCVSFSHGIWGLLMFWKSELLKMILCTPS